MSDAIIIDICICTFRRPHIADTMRSIARLNLEPEWKIRVIVTDNDDTPSAKNLVEDTALECKLDFTYIHAPARNISIARNACLDAAAAPFVAFIDDDEIVTPDWLKALMTCMSNGNADIVLGPVRALYGSACPAWLRKGDFHSTKPVWVRGIIKTGYNGNILLRRASSALQGLRFRKDLGYCGGEDTVFYAEAFKAGARIQYAADAVVTEPVPAERASLPWLVKRYFRSGQTHGLLLLMDNPGILNRIKNTIPASAKILFCMLMALLNIRAERAAFWLLRGTMHAGVVARLAGIRELQPYGQDD